jgi:uncharacterized glyoxalase superfamily protein PhnB
MLDNENMHSSIICGHRYAKAPEAIDWLCSVLGFTRHAVYPAPNGSIMHAELTLGVGMIMLGSIKENEYNRMMKQPHETGGAETRSAYIVVPNADEVYARVQAAGTEIVFPIKDEGYGGRGFTCRDPEGHMWNVGTYDPWAPK